MVSNQGWSRRSLLRSLLALPSFSLFGCISPRLTSAPSKPPQLIDAHCHIFNITDLPAATFVQTVFLKDYPAAGGLTLRQRALRKALTGIQDLLSKRVMTADYEMKYSAMKALLGTAALDANEQRILVEQEREAEAALPPAASAVAGCEPEGHFSPSFASIREWLRSLRSSRGAMARQLTVAHLRSGFTPRLLCPALVDYSNWLGQVLQSALPDQIMMHGKLARDSTLPAVHGYVAFDPLRHALRRNGLTVLDGTWDPLDWARKALVDHGFLGVKLYPPMGFLPAGNAAAAQDYPDRLVRLFGTREKLGSALDAALEEIWALCEELDAPIMAHAANSNAAGPQYGRRADPAYWVGLMARRPKLRVMLGHFGRFGTFSAGLPTACQGGDVPFESTWESAVGRFVQRNPDRLFADISYLSEIFHPAQRSRSIERMKRYLDFDRGARHLIFGSDWVMLGIEKAYADKYPLRVAEFLNACGLSDPEIAGVMHGNAVRFLGLTAGAGSRERLLRFYATAKLDPSRLPS